VGEQPQEFRASELRPLLSAEAEANAFWRVRARVMAVYLRQALQTSRLRISLVVFLSLFFWFGLFALFYNGFHFLDKAIGPTAIHAQTVQAIYNIFFASLTIMLVASSAIILYTGLYCSSEAAFLLTTPARPERIVLHKFQEAIFYSSWGFLLLGSPMLVAYGLEGDAPWYYFALLLPFMITFVYIPGGIGAILCLLIVHHVPRIRFYALVTAGALGVVTTGLIIWSLSNASESNILTPAWFQQLLSRLQFSEHRLLPSWWLSSGLLEAARGNELLFDYPCWAESLKFLAVLFANAMLLHILTVWTAARLYRGSYSELQGDRAPRKPKRLFWMDQVVMRLPLVARPLRLLIVKDLRTFRRDPVQWSQFVIFFGLLALYFLNIRRFSYDGGYVAWVNMISFLNLAVVGLILSTFTTRFIFPMVSLEGRRFWILGLLPIRRESILWAKFLFAAAGSSVPCMLLILMSDVMLRISTLVVLVHQLTCLILCLGLSGIAVGLGARMPDLREESPSKIAAGFGGTLNLVLSAIYIVAVVLLTALPCHFYLAAAEQVEFDLWWLKVWFGLGTLAAIALGLIATIVPMRSGLKAFRALEV
jgi:ABC-2 type transport system permease protein